MKISETCPCGATFDADSQNNYEMAVRNAVKIWRKDHRHEMPKVGICGDASAIISPGQSRMLCRLPARHAGFHSDKAGSDWGYPRATTRRPDGQSDQPTTNPNGLKS